MPTINQIRNAGERELRALLRDLSKRHRREIRQALRTYGSVSAIPESLWTKWQREVEEEEVAALLLLLIAADDWTARRIEEQGIEVGKVRGEQLTGYARTAAERAQKFGQQWIDTTRKTLEGKQRAATEEGRELTGRDVGEVLDDDRIGRAATSQSTNTTSAGQLGARDRAESGDGAETREPGQRVEIQMIWINNIRTTKRPDERTCPICLPLHRTDESVWGVTQPSGPGDDAHPQCRCGLEPKVVVEANLETA